MALMELGPDDADSAVLDMTVPTIVPVEVVKVERLPPEIVLKGGKLDPLICETLLLETPPVGMDDDGFEVVVEVRDLAVGRPEAPVVGPVRDLELRSPSTVVPLGTPIRLETEVAEMMDEMLEPR